MIADLVRTQAELMPDASALESIDGARLTYSALVEQLTRVERDLRDAGIAHDDRVAIVLGDGPDLAVAFLALAAAAGCAPLNPAYREQELEFSLSDLGASAVVVRAGAPSAARSVAERLGLSVLELESEQPGTFSLRPSGRAHPAGKNGRQPAALLLHTSGTTARPKLVPLTDANLVSSAAAIARSLELTPDDRCLAVMPLFHIHGLVASVLAPLAAGSTVVCAPGFDPARFPAWLEEARPTWYTAVPTMHRAVLERLNGAQPPGLRFARSSSAALPVRVSAALEQKLGCPVIEAYGMTEAAHQMASNPLPPYQRKPGSVGLPAGPEIAVLDGEGNVLERGAVGEVAIRGESVFSGYERNEEANGAAFANGWFRTGDEGHLDEDGYLFLRGRLKEIVNRGGEKVSPREVEEAVLAHPAVADVVAFARPHARLGEDVAAAVVLRAGAEVAASELQQFTASRLAPFKVPGTVVFLDELPKGATGKVQRIGMAERLGLGEEIGARPPYAAPRTDLERRLCTLWESLLGVERIGIHDDFVALGGDSLLVAQLLAELAEDGVGVSAGVGDLPAHSILWAPTVERFAALLESGRSRWSVAGGGAFPVEPGRSGMPFFFVPAHDWSTVGLGALGRRLEGEHALHTFELPTDLAPNAVTGVDAVAERIVGDLRVAQPEGPYALGGICFGGAVALEVARRLQAEGDEVSLVLVNPIGERPNATRRRARWLALTLRNRSFVPWLGRRFKRHTEVGKEQRLPVAKPELERALEAASRSYRARPYAGRITVLAGADYTTPKRFWAGVAGGGLEWRPIPHGSAAVFRTRHLDALASELDAVLARC